MKIQAVWAVYFSPTGGTKKIVRFLAETIAGRLGCGVRELEYTDPHNRSRAYSFGADDLVVLGVPVYAGRVPNKLRPDLEKDFQGNRAKAVAVSVYGNRSFGDALTELKQLLEQRDFQVIGAAAAVSRHAFSNRLAADRPNQADLRELTGFALRMAQKMSSPVPAGSIAVMGKEPIGPYYTPLKEDGTPAVFLKAKPMTDTGRCDGCGLCVAACPMGSIDPADQTSVPGICIKCQACVRLCPHHAKYFDNEEFLSHVRMLEANYSGPAQNYFFE